MPLLNRYISYVPFVIIFAFFSPFIRFKNKHFKTDYLPITSTKETKCEIIQTTYANFMDDQLARVTILARKSQTLITLALKIQLPEVYDLPNNNKYIILPTKALRQQYFKTKTVFRYLILVLLGKNPTIPPTYYSTIQSLTSKEKIVDFAALSLEESTTTYGHQVFLNSVGTYCKPHAFNFILYKYTSAKLAVDYFECLQRKHLSNEDMVNEAVRKVDYRMVCLNEFNQHNAGDSQILLTTIHGFKGKLNLINP